MSRKENYLKLFNYLLEFARLRERVTREIEKFEEYLWFSAVPQERAYFSVLWEEGEAREGLEWLKFKKPRRPEFPDAPARVLPWIQPGSLQDFPSGPSLRPEIIEDGLAVSLRDHPEIRASFQRYLEDVWKPWAGKFAEYQKRSETYNTLFRMYERSTKFAEEYELVVGIGLAFFKSGNGTLVKRHLLVANAALVFYPDKELFLLSAGADGANLRFESDMILDLEIGDVVEAERQARGHLVKHELLEIPFSDETKDALRIYINTLTPRGGFNDSNELPGQVGSEPSLYYCPALVLRKRTVKAMTSMMQSIIEYLEGTDGARIPMLDDLFGTGGDGEVSRSESAPTISPANGTGRGEKSAPIVYFPKAWNEEQLSIVRRLQNSDKVLVQGPPGTGKSHTIANLISHLLAQGKRVLVTAFTKRALVVLKNQLPDPIKPLCVNLLGNDRASINDLEASVRTIISRINGYDVDNAAIRIKKLEAEWTSLVSEQREHQKAIVALRCRQTSRHEANRAYGGTLMQIAASVGSNASSFSWLEDTVENLERAEPAGEQLVQLYELHAQLAGRDEVDLKGDLPEEEELLHAEAFASYLEQKQALDGMRRGFPAGGDLSWAERLRRLKAEQLDSLKLKLVACEEAYHSLAACALPWSTEAISACLKGYATMWRDLHNSSLKLLTQDLKEAVAELETSTNVRLLTDIPWERLDNDATALAAYLDEGKSLRGITMLKPKAVRSCLPLVQGVLINERSPVSAEDFRSLALHARAQVVVSRLHKLWQARVPKIESLILQLSQFETSAAELGLILEHSDRIVDAWNELRRDLRDASFVLEQQKISALLYSADMAGRTTVFAPLSDVYEDTVHALSSLGRQAGAHPLADGLLRALVGADVRKYDSLRGAIQELREIRTVYATYLEIRQRVQALFPKMTAKITGGDPSVNRECLSRITEAVLWSHARHYLRQFAYSREERDLELRLKAIELQVSGIIADVAALRAWQHLLQTIEPSQRQELLAWFQAVKKIGKGTGKNAVKFRRLAQQHMNSCKDVIPAWVMPLYRVAETVTPAPGIYDCVIIDEASQLGPDALFLLYLAKKIVIVGDDKQTSPEYVGVSKDAVNQIIQRHLQGVPYREFYGSESSFFDHAERFCEIKGGKIILKEHFRCMPEIIRFSNDLFYAPFGAELLPMRQFSELRLEPKMTVHVSSARTEGQSPNIINRAEAQAIASAIAECLQDPRYTGKTFGVISLQGQKQADLIADLLLDEIGAEAIEERRLICGISSSFQGDERDVLMLSMIVSPEYGFRALTMPGDERRFNVAASRARDQIWLFHSVGRNDFANQDDLRFKLYEFFYDGKPEEPATPVVSPGKDVVAPFESPLELAVYQDIVERGYRAIPQYRVGQFRLDLTLVLNNGMKLAVECDGDKNHGEAEYDHDMVRQRVLERCGWHFVRIRGCEYYNDKESALRELWEAVNRYDSLVLDARPVSAVDTSSVQRISEKGVTREETEIEGGFAGIGAVAPPNQIRVEEEPEPGAEADFGEVETPETPPEISNVGGYFLGSDVTETQRTWFAKHTEVDWLGLMERIKAEDMVFYWERQLLVKLSTANTTGEEVSGRMLRDLEALSNRVPSIWAEFEVRSMHAEVEDHQALSPAQPGPMKHNGLSEGEVRQLLYKLREEIHGKWPEIPWERGVLRKTMLDKLIKHRVTSMTQFREAFTESELARTHLAQMQFLDRIFAVIKLLSRRD